MPKKPRIYKIQPNGTYEEEKTHVYEIQPNGTYKEKN